MKTKLFTLLFAIVASVGTINASVEIGDWYYNLNVEDKTAEVTEASSYAPSITIINIPSVVTYNGENYTVISIGKYAFYHRSYLTSITIPNSITSIGEWAFNGCSGLTSIAIPEGVASIGEYAFQDCTGLTSITIPNSITSIGEWAFYGCSGLTSITIPNGITSIESGTFSDCVAVKSITIPNSVTSIGYQAFSSCAGSKSITIPNSVTSIGSYAFANCSGLKSITIPNSVTSIEEGTFSGCSGLTSVTIPNSVTSIGYQAFSGCTSLPVIDDIRYADTYLVKAVNSSMSSAKIKENTKWISESAFEDYRYLTQIDIPNSVVSIGARAFYGCSGLTSITIPNSVTTIGYNAFDGCYSLPVIDEIRYADTYLIKALNSSMSSVKIKENTRWIGDDAFNNYTNLTQIDIPNSVIGIGARAFYNCKGLTSVTLGNKVTSIGNGAFSGCENMTAINIPNTVTSIGNSAFSGCAGLKSITIPNGVTSIGDYTFSRCANLSYAFIGSGVTSIGNNAFSQCMALTTVELPNSVTSIGDEAFFGAEALKNISIPNNVISIGEKAFYRCYLKTVTIPKSTKWVGSYAFSNTGITSLVIHSEDIVIIDGLFWNCPLETIQNYASTPQKFSYGDGSTSGKFSSFFEGVNRSCKLYVPEESLELYKSADIWKEFGSNILPITAEETEVTSAIHVEPTANTAEVTWEKVDGAYTYELVIKDKSGNVICTLVFNAQGQLTSIAFNAPSRNQAPQQTQSAGFVFTVTGLDSGTVYDYTLTAKNSTGAILKTEQGSFTTQTPTGLDQIPTDQVQSTKMLRDGKIFIERGNKTYTTTGQEMK